MSETGRRMTEEKPDASSLKTWMGTGHYRRWVLLLQSIEATYPGVFTPEWLFGGKKHGWSLRLKKSRSFCTLVPERGKFLVLIVFGREERKKAGGILGGLSPAVRTLYERAKTYHDGKWVLIPVGQNQTLADIRKLLAVKRHPSAVSRRLA